MGFYRGPHVVTDGLVLYVDAANRKSYPGTGTAWNDLSGNGNNGTLINGPTFNTTNGGSVVFDGVNDYVDFGNILNFERTDSFSISGWVNVTSFAAYRILIAKMESSLKGYSLNLETSGQLNFILRNTPSTNALQVRTNTGLISINQWYNIVITYNGNSLPSGVNFYINSIFYPIEIITNNTLSQSIITTYPLNVGARSSRPDGFVYGKIPQVSIYNRTLTSIEILQNYNATKSRFNL